MQALLFHRSFFHGAILLRRDHACLTSMLLPCDIRVVCCPILLSAARTRGMGRHRHRARFRRHRRHPPRAARPTGLADVRARVTLRLEHREVHRAAGMFGYLPTTYLALWPFTVGLSRRTVRRTAAHGT